MKRYIFVYGTLTERIHPGRLTRMGLTFEGEAIAPGRLYDLGPFPAMRPPEDASDTVQGELFSYDTDRENYVLGKLDYYEGFYLKDPEGSLYIRKEITASTTPDDTQVQASVYFYNQDLNGARRVHSGRWSPADLEEERHG